MAWTSSMSSSSIRPWRAVVDVGAPPDQRDDLVERVERLRQAAEDVSSLLGLAQPVARPPLDDLDLVGDPVETNWSRVSVRGTPSTSASMLQREVRLQLGVLVEVVEHDPGDGVALEHDDQLLTGARGACRP